MYGGNSPIPHHATLIMGIVEVTCTMRGTETKERIRIANVCKDVVMDSLKSSWNGVQTDGKVTGKLEIFNTTGIVTVNAPFVQVFMETQMISNQKFQDISTMVALRGSGGLLVIIGKCQLRNLRVAVVLHLSSDQRADLVLDDYQKFKNNVQGSCDKPPFNSGGFLPVGVVKPLPPTPSPPPIPIKPPTTSNKPVKELGVSAGNLAALFAGSSQASKISSNLCGTNADPRPNCSAVAPPSESSNAPHGTSSIASPTTAFEVKPPAKLPAPLTLPKPIIESIPQNTSKPCNKATVPIIVPKPYIKPKQHPAPACIPMIDVIKKGTPHVGLSNMNPQQKVPITTVIETRIPEVPNISPPPRPPKNIQVKERDPDDPLPDIPGSNKRVSEPYITPIEPVLQPRYTNPDENPIRRTYIEPLPDASFTSTQLPVSFTNTTESPLLSPSQITSLPPRPTKSANIKAKLVHMQNHLSGFNIKQPAEPEKEAHGSYNFQNQTFSKEKEFVSGNNISSLNDFDKSAPSQNIYGSFHQSTSTNPLPADIFSNKENKAIFPFGNNNGKRLDFQDDDDDDIPVLRHYRPLPPNSPVPPTKVVYRISTSSDSGQSDTMEEPEYVSQETYYSCLGISVEDSERIYMKRPIRQTKRYSKVPQSLAEDIICFVIDDSKYLGTLDSISKARNDMPPKLQNLLRKCQTLSVVHTKMHNELKNCTDSCSRISQVLLKYRDDLELHIYYLLKAPEINNLMNELPESFLKKYPGIKDEIRSSWKKFTFYILSLEKFLKGAPKEDKAAIREALEMLRDLTKRADTEVLLDGIKGAPYPLHSLGTLLLHSSFVVSGPLLKKDYRIRVLLFSKTIVITQHKNSKYDFLLDIPVTQSYFVTVKQDNSKGFALEVNFGGIQGKKQYVFQAQTNEVKDAWVAEINRIINEFAMEEKKEQEKRHAT